ncbi:MAG: FG-GAP-like repeat-containing protein [Myxococcota bacterium]
MQKLSALTLVVSLLFACGDDDQPGLPDSGFLDGARDLGTLDALVDTAMPDDRAVDMAMADVAIEAGPTCAGTTCNPGQRCDLGSGAPTCVDNECADLSCSETERCEPHPLGGNTCVSIACDEDVQCASEENCSDEGICVADVCTPAVIRCEGEEVRECESNGGGETMLGTCGSASYFATTCVDDGVGFGGCTCEDDWDCPEFTVCDTGTCVGRGEAPTCTLPPLPFDETLPSPEIEWGGPSRDDDDARDGTGALAPWANFSHVLNTPVVANLDDDNGDGLINERDFPEVIFVAHQGNNPWNNGVLRAIHGGGPNRGQDFFARCGDLLWQREAPIGDVCGDSTPDSDSGAAVAVGDLDGNGAPEIVAPTEGNRFRILAADGTEIYRLPSELAWENNTNGETPTIANLDFAGYAEIIVGHTVYRLGPDADGTIEVKQRLAGTESDGRNEGVGQMSCVADLDPSVPGAEFVAGGTAYRLPADLDACDTPCADGVLDIVWDAGGQGYCAIADVWGADTLARPGPANPLDGVPEVVLIDDGNLRILQASDGETILDEDLGGGRRGGAPNVDDFDGDGFMEIASALQNFYVVVDLQEPAAACPAWPTTIARATADDGSHNANPARTPGDACTTDAECAEGAVCNATLARCVCLHNGWQRDSDDDSSRATSSSVFDFNGDGAAEVLYNDECDFRVYAGTSGETLFSAQSRSRTGIENPVVADVDNDGNAEVVTVSNTATGNRCDEDGANPVGPNGIRIWGDPTDAWVSARRIWNQQSYFVVNTTESGAIPSRPPESWGEFQGRRYNTYRSQPRSFGVAPDLEVVAVAVSSPDVGCGTLSDTIEITFQIRNAGDLRVGPGVQVALYGTWDGTEEALLTPEGDPLELTLTASLEPGRSVFLSVTYARSSSVRDQLPDSVRVEVDPASATEPFGAERECNEANNDRSTDVSAGERLADLLVEVGAPTLRCSMTEVDVPIAVRNEGTEDAMDVVVALYAGDPALGGEEIARVTLDESVPAMGMASTTVTLESFPRNRDIRIFAVVDPDNTVAECNDANNGDDAPEDARCDGLI